MIKSHKQQKFGFTLVETLVAISILMIAIAGPLSVASKALAAAIDARNQMIAYNLAQESMEFIENAKDNDTTDTIWSFIKTCSLMVPCGASVIQTNTSSVNPLEGITTCPNFNNCKLTTTSSLSGVSGYSYNTGALSVATPFTRKFYAVVGSTVSGHQDAQITVVVSWSTGAVTNQVEIQKVMTNAAR